MKLYEITFKATKKRAQLCFRQWRIKKVGGHQ
jgi:hypothetical protein